MNELSTAPAFGGGDNLDAILDEMEAGATVLETKAMGAPRRPAAKSTADPVKAAVVQIGKEVLKIGETVNELKQQRAPASPRTPLPSQRRSVRQTGDPTSLRTAHDGKLRAFEVYQQALAEVDRQRKSGRGVDPLTVAKLGRLDGLLDRYGDVERNLSTADKLDAIKRRLSVLEVKRDRPPGLASRYPGAGGGLVAGRKAAGEQYKQAVVHWMRTGQESFKGQQLADLQRRAIELKALNTELNPDGGYIVLSERESNPLDAYLLELSAMRQRATVRTITTNELVRPINKRGAEAGWVAERGTRAETEAPTLAQDRFPVMELYAQPAATQTLLDDAATDVESWLAQEVVDAFALQESPAFMTGTGGTQPRGLLSYDFVTDHSTWDHGKFRLIETGVSGAFPPTNPTGSPPTMPDDTLLNVVYSLKPGHRQNASWLLNRATISVIRKFRDVDGRPLWQPSMQAGQPPEILGFPIDEDEYMPDIGVDTVAVGFGDWKRTYLIIDRIGVRVLRDPYTQKPFILFYTTKRVGGGAQYFDAAVFLRFST